MFKELDSASSNVMPADYHTHTPLCHHAEGAPEEYIAAALAAGLSEYGISDHAPMTPEPFDDWRMAEADLPKYFEWIERARSSAGSLPVRAGLECDWLTGGEEWIEHLAELYDWDYLIGSIHYLGDKWDFDNPKWLGRWAETDVEEIWTLYWQEYLRMVETGLFDIYGHADLIKKFSYRPQGDLKRFYAPVIEAISTQNGTIELNTAGWHKPCNEQYPADLFLSMAYEADIGLVISSDAHAPAEVSRDFDKAIILAKNCGFTHTRLFEGRRHEESLLD